MADQTPVAAPGIVAPNNPTAWRAPGSGTPLKPDDVAAPSADEIAARVAARLTVPKGPLRTVNLILGVGAAGPISGALNSVITLPILGGPGIIRSLDFQAQIVATGAAMGTLQLTERGDSNSPTLRTFLCNVGAAGTFLINHSLSPGTGLPFLNGMVAVWTPLVMAFGTSVIVMNIDYESIPIGQRG